MSQNLLFLRSILEMTPNTDNYLVAKCCAKFFLGTVKTANNITIQHLQCKFLMIFRVWLWLKLNKWSNTNKKLVLKGTVKSLTQKLPKVQFGNYVAVRFSVSQCIVNKKNNFKLNWEKKIVELTFKNIYLHATLLQ